METTQVMDLMHGSVVPLAMSYQKGFPPHPRRAWGPTYPPKCESISMCSPRDDHWFDWDLCSLCSAQSSQGKGTPPEKKCFLSALARMRGGEALAPIKKYIIYIYL